MITGLLPKPEIRYSAAKQFQDKWICGYTYIKDKRFFYLTDIMFSDTGHFVPFRFGFTEFGTKEAAIEEAQFRLKNEWLNFTSGMEQEKY